MGSELATGFDCGVCGLHHEVLPLSYSVRAPRALLLSAFGEAGAACGDHGGSVCDRWKDFYLRGRIAVPVVGLEEPFIWGVWVEVGPKNFVRTNEMWGVAGREREAAFSGWLDTELPLYGDTVNLEVRVETQVVGRRPHFFVVDEEHQLAVEQRKGISMGRVVEIAESVLHDDEDVV